MIYLLFISYKLDEFSGFNTPAVVDREHLFREDMLRHDTVKHGSNAVDGHVWVTHPQDSIKLGKDEGHGRQRGCLSKHLHHRDPTNLHTSSESHVGSGGRGRTLKKQFVRK